jgi:hypothetical protein
MDSEIQVSVGLWADELRAFCAPVPAAGDANDCRLGEEHHPGRSVMPAKEWP